MTYGTPSAPSKPLTAHISSRPAQRRTLAVINPGELAAFAPDLGKMPVIAGWYMFTLVGILALVFGVRELAQGHWESAASAGGSFLLTAVLAVVLGRYMGTSKSFPSRTEVSTR
ncbi:MAG: hypothetical protein AAGC55_03865 [Myxococcota bacterium]